MLKSLAETLSDLSLWKLRFLTFLLGGVGAMALPPFYLFPALLSFIGLILILEVTLDQDRPYWHSFWFGWWFGFGYFTFGLYWVAHALFVDIEKFWWVLPFSVLGLPFILSFFTAASTVCCAITRWRGLGLGLGFAVFWVAGEWLRAHLFTGFPWNLLGYSWSFSDAMIQLASVTGIYGLSLLSLLIVVGTMALLDRRDWPWVGSIAALAGGVFVFGFVRLSSPIGVHEDQWIRLVQPSVPQTVKWDPNEKENNFIKLRTLSKQPASYPLKAVIWPETAVPFFLEQDPFRRELIGQAAPSGGLVITGAPRRTPYGVDPVEVWNSIVAIDSQGDVVGAYDKSHLVPFGEYMPFRGMLEPYLELKKITAGELDFSAGPGPEVLKFGDLPSFGGLVCYESIFPGAVVSSGEERPQWLLNVTNDGWYGVSPGPYQHLQISRMRAVEEGIPLVRSANTGVSAVYDAHGKRVGSLGLMEVGVYDFQLPKALTAPTIYGKYGDWVIFCCLLLMIVVLIVQNRRGAYERFYFYQ